MDTGVLNFKSNLKSSIKEMIRDTQPFYESVHVNILNALMNAYYYKSLTMETVVEKIKLFPGVSAAYLQPFDLEDALLIWVNQVINQHNKTNTDDKVDELDDLITNFRTNALDIFRVMLSYYKHITISSTLSPEEQWSDILQQLSNMVIPFTSLEEVNSSVTTRNARILVTSVLGDVFSDCVKSRDVQNPKSVESETTPVKKLVKIKVSKKMLKEVAVKEVVPTMVSAPVVVENKEEEVAEEIQQVEQSSTVDDAPAEPVAEDVAVNESKQDEQEVVCEDNIKEEEPAEIEYHEEEELEEEQQYDEEDEENEEEEQLQGEQHYEEDEEEEKENEDEEGMEEDEEEDEEEAEIEQVDEEPEEDIRQEQPIQQHQHHQFDLVDDDDEEENVEEEAPLTETQQIHVFNRNLLFDDETGEQEEEDEVVENEIEEQNDVEEEVAESDELEDDEHEEHIEQHNEKPSAQEAEFIQPEPMTDEQIAEYERMVREQVQYLEDSDSEEDERGDDAPVYGSSLNDKPRDYDDDESEEDEDAHYDYAQYAAKQYHARDDNEVVEEQEDEYICDEEGHDYAQAEEPFEDEFEDDMKQEQHYHQQHYQEQGSYSHRASFPPASSQEHLEDRFIPDEHEDIEEQQKEKHHDDGADLQTTPYIIRDNVISFSLAEAARREQMLKERGTLPPQPSRHAPAYTDSQAFPPTHDNGEKAVRFDSKMASMAEMESRTEPVVEKTMPKKKSVSMIIPLNTDEYIIQDQSTKDQHEAEMESHWNEQLKKKQSRMLTKLNSGRKTEKERAQKLRQEEEAAKMEQKRAKEEELRRWRLEEKSRMRAGVHFEEKQHNYQQQYQLQQQQQQQQQHQYVQPQKRSILTSTHSQPSIVPRLTKNNNKSNKQVIKNALNAILAGGVNAKVRQEVLEDMEDSKADNFIILLRDNKNHSFRGLYSYDAELGQVLKVYAGTVGPDSITSADVVDYFKYDTGSRTLKTLPTKAWGMSVHAVALTSAFLPASKMRKMSKK